MATKKKKVETKPKETKKSVEPKQPIYSTTTIEVKVDNETETISKEEPIVETTTISNEDKVLMEYAEFMRTLPNRRQLNSEQAEKLWKYWQAYTHRTDRFTMCSNCIIIKNNYMKAQCKKKGITI